MYFLWYLWCDLGVCLQEEEEDECAGVPTPPDSPNTAARERATSNGAIDPDVEIYAIESNESKSKPLFVCMCVVLSYYFVYVQYLPVSPLFLISIYS